MTLSLWTTWIFIPKLKSCILTYILSWHTTRHNDGLTSWWHSEQLSFWFISWKSCILTYWRIDIMSNWLSDTLMTFSTTFMLGYLMLFPYQPTDQTTKPPSYQITYSNQWLNTKHGTRDHRSADPMGPVWWCRKSPEVVCDLRRVYRLFWHSILNPPLLSSFA